MEDEIQTTAPQYPHKVLIPSHLAMAILVTMFCCLPFGVIAIIYACKTDAATARGDISQALAYSNSAQKWSLAAVVLGLIYIISMLAAQAGNIARLIASNGQF